MRINTLSILGLGLLLVGAGLWISSEEQISSEFVPRVNQELKADADGANEIQRMLRGNIQTGQVEESDFIELRNAVQKFAKSGAQKSAPNLEWTSMGPDNVGGRTRAILIETESIIYTGGVSGGLWRSTNGANTWHHVPSFPNCMIGSIAKSLNGTYYVGTGSLFDGAGGDGGSGFRGRGVYRSSDAVNWTLIPNTDPGEFNTGDWTAVDCLVADPNNPGRVFVGSNAGFGYLEGDVVEMGFAEGIPNQDIQDIFIAPDNSYMLVVAGSGRVYRSTNSSFTTFEEKFGNDDGQLPQSGIGRARVAISQDDANFAYAVFATSAGGFGGLYASTDAGVEWEVVWPGGNPEFTPLPRNQGIYDLALGIKKNDPGIAYVGGIEVWRAGVDQQAELAAYSFNFPGSNNSVHADIHEIVFSPGGNMYIACDGGIYKSTDGGETYTASNRGLNITQFYGIAHSAGNAVAGGTQDNGTMFIPYDGSLTTLEESIDVFGGDGFDTEISQVTNATSGSIFVTSQNGVLARFQEGGAGGMFYDDEIIDLMNDDGEIGQFYTCIRLHENTADEDSQQYVILVNPYTESVEDSTFNLNTANLDLPFTYTLPEGEVLEFWAELIRPDRVLEEPLLEDPDYFWLDVQALSDTMFDCMTDSTEAGTVTEIDQIIPIDSCFYFEPLDEIICVTYDYDTTYTETMVYDYTITCDTMYHYESDTLFDVREQLKITDPYTTMFSIGFVGNQGVWMTREGLNFNTTPNWFKIATAPGGGGTKAMEYTPDGHHMFISGWNGTVKRVSNLHLLWTEDDLGLLEETTILSGAGSAVTGVAVDPNNPEHVVITVGGYGTVGGGKVRETWNALDASPNWDNIWFANSETLAKMPCYDVVVDVNDDSGQTIIVGTEYGIFTTDDSGDTWTISNTGMASAIDAVACPVFDLKQQWRGHSPWMHPTNNGNVYAGTHGRGIFFSDELTFTGIDSPDQTEIANNLLVYPNPVTGGIANVQIELASTSDVTMRVYTVNGQIVRDIQQKNLVAGQHQLRINTSDLPRGQYFLRMETGSTSQVAKFVVVK
jgi:hypothetical protein